MSKPWLRDAPPPDADAAPSKTQRKHEMHALQDLGERMAELGSERLKQLALPDALATALTDYRRFTKWEAKRRQMQYIGRLMRDIDPAPIAAQLDLWSGTSRAAVAGFHAAESWRDRLLAGGDALGALLAEHPRTEVKRITQLIAKAHDERAAGRPPASARLLFRELTKLLGPGPPASEAKSAATAVDGTADE